MAKNLLAQSCRTAPRARNVIKSSIDNYLGLYDRIGMTSSLTTPKRGTASALSRSEFARLGAPGTADGGTAVRGGVAPPGSFQLDPLAMRGGAQQPA